VVRLLTSSDPLPGYIEALYVGRVKHSQTPLRIELGRLDGLMASILEKGLLHPIVVRPMGGDFEVVAGNRRLEACKKLGMRKVTCHILDLGDREAYEVSLIENVQRQTLNPVEEAKAYKKYVDEYGYGSVSDLALKIGKSEEYVSHRIGLLSLPREVLEKVSRCQLTASHAEELKGLRKSEQLEIAQLVVEEHMSSKHVRKIARRAKLAYSGDPLPMTYSRYLGDEREAYVVDRTFGKCITALKVAMMRFDDALEDIVGDDEWAVKESLLENRNMIHRQVDNLLRLKRKTRRARVFLERMSRGSHGINSSLHPEGADRLVDEDDD
jgi:ParB family transcriptional regulator, chromosome partitioning protein